MRRLTGSLIGVAFGLALASGAAWATPPEPGEHFDCSDGGDSSCATDDAGCVSDTPAHGKCSAAFGKAFSKAIASVIKCHGKEAAGRVKGGDANGLATAEESCENNAKNKLDAALAKVASICSAQQNGGAAGEEAVIFAGSNVPLSLDGQNSLVFCDSSSGALLGDDDSGWVPNSPGNLKCALTVGKALSKLVAGAIKCHSKMDAAFAKGKDFDEETCEETDPISHKGALDRYNQQRDKLAGLGICPPCLNSAGLDSIAASALSQADAGAAVGNPCAP